MDKIKLLESPRDGIQGLKKIIPAQSKIGYINSLLQVGFDIIDFGSFVSPKSIPQLSDTDVVVRALNVSETKTKLMVVIGNCKGAESAAQYEAISYLAFPFSTSETFLQKNINSDLKKAPEQIKQLLDICDSKGKILTVYISMAFGNPYGDEWNINMVTDWVDKLATMGVSYIALSDITAVATPETIETIFSSIIPAFSTIDFGLHLHTTPGNWYEKIDAAYQSGCRIFDAVINGAGGCPMTGYELVGNLETGSLLDYFDKNKIKTTIDMNKFIEIQKKASWFYGLGESL